jgi:hypothetical protein
LSVSESEQHKKIKDLIGCHLKEWTGATLQEYPSSGHELDVLAMTPDGISIYIEVIWAATLQNFYRDMFMVQNSDANVKLVIANPKLLADEKCQRIFEKAAISQRKFGVAMYGELIDGERVLSDKSYVENEIKAVILNMVAHVQKYGKTVGRHPEITLPEPEIADKIEEDLLSNLFPILSFPATIYSSPTWARRVGDVFKALGDAVENQPFLPKNRRLYTFDNLNNPASVFAPIINKNEIFEESSTVWLKDELKRNDLIYLFNLSLEKYCRKRNMRYDRDHDRYVCLLKDGKDYLFGWRAKLKYIERKVARRILKNGELVFCIHYAASLNFMYIDESLFLKIEPTKVFTSDGTKPIRKQMLAKLMSRYLSKEYNKSYMSSVRFWAKFLSKLDAKLTISIGSQHIEIDTNPVGTHIPVGIAREEAT